MKLSDVPKRAFSASPTSVPKKEVPDWDALYQVLRKRGFVIIESDDLRMTSNGSEECVPVKQFNCHLRLIKGVRLLTKRIGANRWFCTI